MGDDSRTWGASRRRRASARPTQPALVQPGATLAGRYRILEPLGEGGMGIVYAAEHVRLGKRVAIKVLAAEPARDRELVARFEQEARAASKIGHEHIIDVTDFGESDDGAPFIVMEFLQGRDLGRHLAEGPMPVARVARIVWQVCRAVGAAHGKGIVHRDLKPENIFLVERESQPDFVKVLDFGLAKMAPSAGGPRLTREGTVFGTSLYMSPEQARGEAVDPRSDVYAAGCILYEMLAGEVPFSGASFEATLRMHVAEAAVAPSARAPERGLSPALDAVVLRALAKDRAARHPSMKELALALCDAVGGDRREAWPDPSQRSFGPMGGAMAVGTAAPSRAQSARTLALAFGGVAAVAAIGAFAWLHAPRVETIAPPPRAETSTAAAAPTPAGTAPAPSPHAPSPPASSAHAPSAHAPPPAPSRIHVASDPNGAEVRRDGALVGKTPLVLELAATTPPFDLTLHRHGYRPSTLHVAPDRDRDYVLPLERVAAAPTPVKPADPAKPSLGELKEPYAE